MAIQTINIGTIANDGTGDDLREAFVKVNGNFLELDLRSPEATSASNLGTGGQGLFAEKVGNDLQFKKIVAGVGTTLSSDANSVTINTTSTGLNEIQVFADNTNVFVNSAAPTLTLAGGGTTTTTLSGNTVTISSTTALSLDSNPTLSANLNGAGFNITGTGNIESNVYGLDLRTFDGVQKLNTEFDLGAITQTITNLIQYQKFKTIEIDMGTNMTDSPTEPNLHFGTF